MKAEVCYKMNRILNFDDAMRNSRTSCNCETEIINDIVDFVSDENFIVFITENAVHCFNKENIYYFKVTEVKK